MKIAHVTLTLTQGGPLGQSYRFDDRVQCVVGRADDCEIQLPSDSLHFDVSRHHCAFEIEPPIIRVRDLGSLNGTYVNGQRIGQRLFWQAPADLNVRLFADYGLKDGDIVKIGGTTFEVGIVDDLGDVGERVSKAPYVLLCLDYDGALTPFVEDPSAAYLSPSMQRVLRSLSDHESVTLAVISVRERADLVAHVGIPGVVYAGNHGLEISGPGCLFVESTAAAHSEAIKDLGKELTKRLRHFQGVFVEDKGLTLSVHYRLAGELDLLELEASVQSALSGHVHLFEMIPGDKVFEIRPRVNWNIGTAVEWILQQLHHPEACVVYLGDDVKEADLLDTESSAALREGVTINVSDAANGAGEHELKGPAEVRRFLETVERLVRRKDSDVPVAQGKA